MTDKKDPKKTQAAIPKAQAKDTADGEISLEEKIKRAEEDSQKREEKQHEQIQKEEDGEIDRVRKELEQMTELAKRTMADLTNLRRRQEEEKSYWVRLANADLIKSILPILDNLDRAMTHAPKELDDWGKGIQMSINQLHQVMKNAGLTEIECVGKPFDPDLHEAMAQDKGEKNIILEVFEKGYRIGERVIRHAKVKVGNGEAVPPVG